jgi:predicted nucleic acid binding AN1-type Zn finger protein
MSTPQEPEKKVKRARCANCSKILSLATTFNCSCKNNFCSAHRLPESHSCSRMGNIKEKEIFYLQEQLVKVVGEKLEKC